MNLQQPRKPSRMIAAKEDPWISVSLLSEHTYCARAGIIQNEAAEEDTGEETFFLGRGRGMQIFYDFKQLRRKMKHVRMLMLWFLLASLLAFLTVVVIFYIDQKLGAIPYIIFVFCCLCFCLVINCFRFLNLYLFHYLPAKLRRPSMPDPNHTESQMIHWWGLINAGFQPIRPQEQYRDVQWHLAGRPWLVLVKGSLRIPVFKKRPNRGNAGEKLFRQHYARMAAYSHLLEKCENAHSPYGIVLFGGTHIGMTVPYKPSSKKTFHDNLLGARASIINSTRFLPPYPHNPQICVLCPHSRRDRDTDMSVCGTRFNWTPPNYRDEYE